MYIHETGIEGYGKQCRCEGQVLEVMRKTVSVRDRYWRL